MTAIRHLANAPIKEALVDLKAKVPAGFSVQSFTGLKESLSDRFPVLEEQREMEAVLEMKEGKLVQPETKDLGIRGYVFRSADRTNVVQFRRDGFTFNRLKPYTSWEEIFPIAWDLWKVYVAKASPEVVTRAAVRYINRLRIPSESVDFDDYLTAGPKIPAELPQYVGNFLSRVLIHEPETDLAANVTQALEPRVEPGLLTLIIDIDVFKVRDWKPDDPDLAETFERLRAFKNRVFFNHITERTARLFE